MPATIEVNSTSELSPSRRDSTFTYEPGQSSAAEMDRLRIALLSRSTEHVRTESVDSGIGDNPPGVRCPLPLAMKRTASASVNHRSSCSSISDQTHLLLEKMLILEKKLNSMETQLKNEQVQRLGLEAKVVKLERDNEQLKSSRAQAGLQLQNFAEVFYAETETIKLNGSCNPSPHPSMAELRRSRTNSPHHSLAELRRSRTDSMSSNGSSRLSHVSM